MEQADGGESAHAALPGHDAGFVEEHVERDLAERVLAVRVFERLDHLVAIA